MERVDTQVRNAPRERAGIMRKRPSKIRKEEGHGDAHDMEGQRTTQLVIGLK